MSEIAPRMGLQFISPDGQHACSLNTKLQRRRPVLTDVALKWVRRRGSNEH